MKLKTSIILILVLIASNVLFAQVIKAYGIKLGFSSSNIVVKNAKPIIIGNNKIMLDYPSGQLISPTISIWAKFIKNEIFNAEFEASYIQKGLCESQTVAVTNLSDPDGTGEKENYKFTETFEYLQININGQFKYNIGKVVPYGIIGPAISYLLSSENFLIEKNRRRNFIFGYNLGIGINFSKLIGKDIFIEARYNGDFSGFYDTGSADFWNKVWVFDLGIGI